VGCPKGQKTATGCPPFRWATPEIAIRPFQGWPARRALKGRAWRALGKAYWSPWRLFAIRPCSVTLWFEICSYLDSRKNIKNCQKKTTGVDVLIGEHRSASNYTSFLMWVSSPTINVLEHIALSRPIAVCMEQC
jgi:hypothetical protein